MIFEMTDQPLWQQLRDQAVQDLRNNKSAPTSPAAQAVLDAFNAEWPDGLAAALEAVADQVDWESGDPKFLVRAIAAELGAHQ